VAVQTTVDGEVNCEELPLLVNGFVTSVLAEGKEREQGRKDPFAFFHFAV